MAVAIDYVKTHGTYFFDGVSVVIRGMVGGVKEIVRREKQGKMGAFECWVIFLWRFGHLPRGEPIAKRRRQFFAEAVLSEDARNIRARCWIWNCGAGSERGFLA